MSSVERARGRVDDSFVSRGHAGLGSSLVLDGWARRSGWVALVGLLALHGIVGRARAQTGESASVEGATTVERSGTEREDDDRRARVHFESGRQYFDEGEYERAVEEFTRAYELSERPVLLMNVAFGLERLGRYAEAADRMQAYCDQAQDTVPTREVLARRIANLRERAARVEAEARARARLGHPTRASTDRPTHHPTGSPTGSLTGHTPDEPSLPSSVDSSLSLPRVSGPDRGRGRRLGAGLSFAVAGAGLVAFGVLGSLALGERASVEEGCGEARACSSRAVRRMDRLALGADLGLAVAAAGVVAGVSVLVWMAPVEGDEPRAALVPFLGRESGGALVRGRF